jgi:hypothetical protein
MFNEWVGDD